MRPYGKYQEPVRLPVHLSLVVLVFFNPINLRSMVGTHVWRSMDKGKGRNNHVMNN